MSTEQTEPSFLNKLSGLFRKKSANPLNTSNNADPTPFSRYPNESEGGKRKSRKSRRKRKPRKTHKKR